MLPSPTSNTCARFNGAEETDEGQQTSPGNVLQYHGYLVLVLPLHLERLRRIYAAESVLLGSAQKTWNIPGLLAPAAHEKLIIKQALVWRTWAQVQQPATAVTAEAVGSACLVPSGVQRSYSRRYSLDGAFHLYAMSDITGRIAPQFNLTGQGDRWRGSIRPRDLCGGGIQQGKRFASYTLEWWPQLPARCCIHGTQPPHHILIGLTGR